MFFEITDFDTKRYEIIDRVKKDLFAADLKLTLFIVACQSANRKCSKQQCNPDRKCLLDTFQNLPGVPIMLDTFRHPKLCSFDKIILDCIHWLMVIRCDPKIIRVHSSTHKEILESICEKQEINPIPDYMFKVDYCPFTKYANEWKLKKGQYQLKYGYHVTELKDCFIKLFIGTHKLSENVPLSLNSNLTESYKQASFHQSWCRSMLGPNIKILLLIEFIDHPNLVSVYLKKTKLITSNPNYNIGLKGKKFIIGDPTIARYAYILVYRKKCCERQLFTSVSSFIIFAIFVFVLSAVLTGLNTEIKYPTIRAF